MKLNTNISMKSIKMIILIILSMQTSAMVLILRYSRSSDSHHYIISTAVLLSEILKIIISLILLFIESKGILTIIANKLLEDVIFNMRETSKLIIPAALYVVQNNLLFVALTNLDAASYQVTYQLKILTTALFSWIMLGRKLTSLHWFSLSFLMIGVSLVQISDVAPPSSVIVKAEESSDRGLNQKELERELKLRLNEAHNNTEMSWFIGVLAVFISCLSSGFSGVYFERLVKKGRNFSLYIRNIQLGIFSVIFSFVAVYGDSREISEQGFFYAYSASTWTVIILQAFGGLIVALTMKYADNILKGFATSVSIIMSTIISWTLLGDPAPSFQFIIGASIVIGATFLYGIASSTKSVLEQPSVLKV